MKEFSCHKEIKLETLTRTNPQTTVGIKHPKTLHKETVDKPDYSRR
jgi:hypothetical protein